MSNYPGTGIRTVENDCREALEIQYAPKGAHVICAVKRSAVAIGLRQIICYSSCKFANLRIINVLLSLLCISSLHHTTETEPQLPLANRFPNLKPSIQ
jgi:hypothetical protein